MPFPLLLRYNGEATPVTLPLYPASTRTRTWWQALAYVNKTITPAVGSFTLYDEQFAIRYEGGQPNQDDLRALLEALRHGLDPYPPLALRQAA